MSTHLRHERYIQNNSNDTITVFNPDFDDTVYTILPGNRAMIYAYEILDTKQESELCGWKGTPSGFELYHPFGA